MRRVIYYKRACGIKNITIEGGENRNKEYNIEEKTEVVVLSDTSYFSTQKLKLLFLIGEGEKGVSRETEGKPVAN